MDEIFKKANEDKEKLEMEVQRIFTIIRNELNKREDNFCLKLMKYLNKNFLKKN